MSAVTRTEVADVKPVVEDAAAAPTTGKRKADAPVSVDTFAQRRMMKELAGLRKVDQRATEQLVLEVIDENDITRWRAKWYYDNADSPDASNTQKRIAEQLRSRGLEFVEFRLIFPENYPEAPPFVYNHYPRLIGPYVFGAGGLCLQTLNQKHGWSCASRAQSLVVAVRAMLENAGCRLQNDDPKRHEAPFCESGARADNEAVARIHSSGWHGSAGRS